MTKVCAETIAPDWSRPVQTLSGGKARNWRDS
jgi:hypothetical protein